MTYIEHILEDFKSVSADYIKGEVSPAFFDEWMKNTLKAQAKMFLEGLPEDLDTQAEEGNEAVSFGFNECRRETLKNWEEKGLINK